MGAKNIFSYTTHKLHSTFVGYNSYFTPETTFHSTARPKTFFYMKPKKYLKPIAFYEEYYTRHVFLISRDTESFDDTETIDPNDFEKF